MNPIEKKILEAGGTILSEPLFIGGSDDINPNCADQLFEALERPERRHREIWRAIKRKPNPQL